MTSLRRPVSGTTGSSPRSIVLRSRAELQQQRQSCRALVRFSVALHTPRLSPPLPPLRKGGKSGRRLVFFPPLRRGDTGGFFECRRAAPSSSSRRLKTALTGKTRAFGRLGPCARCGMLDPVREQQGPRDSWFFPDFASDSHEPKPDDYVESDPPRLSARDLRWDHRRDCVSHRSFLPRPWVGEAPWHPATA